ncbi:hypothetical protein CDAR_413171, partial [Caerostris darwini]
MHTSKHKVRYFVIVFVYCVLYFETGASVDSENNFVSLYQYEESDAQAIGNEAMFKATEFQADVQQAEGCDCKNGMCVKKCVSEADDGACKEEAKVCECSPEFGKTTSNECSYCNCGLNINCTFRQTWRGSWERTCICPENYHLGEEDKCQKNCDGDHPCQNGGECKKECANASMVLKELSVNPLPGAVPIASPDSLLTVSTTKEKKRTTVFVRTGASSTIITKKDAN